MNKLDLARCPHCEDFMEPYGHDGVNFYKCHQSKNCPINFQMDVWYPEGTKFSDDWREPHVHKGIILDFNFEIGDLYCRVQSSGQRRGAINQAHIPWDEDPIFYLDRTYYKEGKPFWTTDDPEKTEMRKQWDPILHVPFNFEIDFKNPQAFKEKLKVWMTFS